jgi:type II restriction enzyme
MTRLTAANLVREIAALDRNVDYHYVSAKNKGRIRVVRVEMPEGPVVFKRFTPSGGETASAVAEENISSPMIWRVANAISEGVPINVDRILGASYNTRSVLEALLANTAQFFVCSPGRIEQIGDRTEIRAGHKHLIWSSAEVHQTGRITRKQLDGVVISEIPTASVIYDAVTLPASAPNMDIEAKRRHVQMQVALVEIGRQLGFQSWIAQNDHGILYKEKRLIELDGVVPRLNELQQVSAYPDAAEAGKLIDLIWFKNGRLMPAVIEIEHSTGITSGLTRMQKFKNALPPFPARYVIVAPDEDREKVLTKASDSQFRSLGTKYFPYSAVEELYSLCLRRRPEGVSEQFLDCFMESVVN